MTAINYNKRRPFWVALIATVLISQSAASAQDNRNKLPEIGTSAVSTLSLDKEERYGDAMMRSLRASQPIVQDPVLIEYINHLGNSLVLNANDVHYKFRFFILNNQEINAFAFFGGHIGIHTGLITLADNESELASVLAHEISHVTQRHLARKMEAQSRTAPMSLAGMISGVLVSLVNPEAGFAILNTSIAAGQQASINYTRINEKEADRVGIRLLALSGFDPNGAPEFFRKMASKYRYSSKPPAMLLTHPLPESRIADARNRAQSLPQKLLPPSLDFELAKARIRARYEGDPSDNVKIFLSELAKKHYQIEQAAVYGLAMSYFEDKQYQQAELTLEPLLEQDPQNLFYVDLMTDIHLQQKHYQQALTMLSKLNLLMPNNQVVTLNYANAALQADQLDLASQLLQDFIIVQGDNFIAHDLLSDVYKKQKKDAQMHSSRAEVYALMGVYPKAIDELQTGLNHTEQHSVMYKRLKARILQFQAQEKELKKL
ncbi:M48 family metalloprotease [Thalassotalea aquiviva]|uniref:beta-barrel assembly-enhancing protease n=1 Tax=Thalassotalea aquiviva TaxID=3242415 RepID=UPI00352A8AF5